MVTATPCTDFDLVLASTSRYRRDLLARVCARFRQVAPDLDETPLAGEAADALALRLAIAKAQVVAERCPGAWVIGSDQVASLDGQKLGKPGNAERAIEQLTLCAGRTVEFLTAVSLIDGRNQQVGHALDRTRVVFRNLPADEIAAYVVREQPWDCAGSFKSEGLGIALFERIESSDPTALVGLPLIALCALMRAAGLPILAS